MKALRQRINQLVACSVSVALLASSSHADILPSPVNSLERLTPPHSIGTLSDLYKGTDPRTVILVQDLHVNYEAQQNIENLLAHYSSQKQLPSFIAVEGADGPIDASVMASFPQADIRRESADYFMKKGELSGPAAFAVSQGLPNLLYGVEKGTYYEANKALYQKSLEARKSLARELAALERPLTTLKRSAYTADMRRLDRHCAKYAKGEIPREDYAESFARLRALAVSPLQKNLVEADHSVHLLTRILAQKAIEDEVKEVATNLSVSLQILSNILNLNEKALTHVADAVKASIEFYVLAGMREQPMFENTLSRMNATKSPVGLLVAGGFHTKGLSALLKAKGISYVVITPVVNKINASDEQLYEDRLMGKHVSVEEVLADKSQDKFQGGASLMSTGFDFLSNPSSQAAIAAAEGKSMLREVDRLTHPTFTGQAGYPLATIGLNADRYAAAKLAASPKIGSAHLSELLVNAGRLLQQGRQVRLTLEQMMDVAAQFTLPVPTVNPSDKSFLWRLSADRHEMELIPESQVQRTFFFSQSGTEITFVQTPNENNADAEKIRDAMEWSLVALGVKISDLPAKFRVEIRSRHDYQEEVDLWTSTDEPVIILHEDVLKDHEMLKDYVLKERILSATTHLVYRKAHTKGIEHLPVDLRNLRSKDRFLTDEHAEKIAFQAFIYQMGYVAVQEAHNLLSPGAVFTERMAEVAALFRAENPSYANPFDSLEFFQHEIWMKLTASRPSTGLAYTNYFDYLFDGLYLKMGMRDELPNHTVRLPDGDTVDRLTSPHMDRDAEVSPESAADARSAHIIERIENAIGEKLPAGAQIFWPEHDFMAGEPLYAIRSTRSAVQALDMLGNGVLYEGYLRGVDGAGSSNDLPGKFREQRNSDAKGLGRFSSTPTFASDFKVKVRFEKASDPETVEYVAPQYKAHSVYREVTQPGSNGLISQKDAPNYILRLFGLTGIKVTMEDVDLRAIAGGMGTSGAFNLALLEFSNHYSGAGLSQADLISLGVYLENVTFGGLTGGQEAISTMMGGGYLHIWLRGFKDAEGQFPNGHISIPLPQDKLEEFSKHAVLLQAGKTYTDGKADLNRFASLTNIGWTDGIEDGDPYIVKRHLDNVRLTFEYVDAIRRGDWDAVARALDQYVTNRDKNSIRWMNVVLDWHEGKRDGLPAYAEKWANRVFKEEGNPHYEQFGAIRNLYSEHGDKLRTMSLYTLDPLAAEVAAARKAGVALFPLGAGGPTTIAILFDAKGMQHMRKNFLDPRGYPLLTQEMAHDAMTLPGRHEQKGYIPYAVGLERGQLVGVDTDPSLGPIVVQGNVQLPTAVLVDWHDIQDSSGQGISLDAVDVLMMAQRFDISILITGIDRKDGAIALNGTGINISKVGFATAGEGRILDRFHSVASAIALATDPDYFGIPNDHLAIVSTADQLTVDLVTKTHQGIHIFNLSGFGDLLKSSEKQGFLPAMTTDESRNQVNEFLSHRGIHAPLLVREILSRLWAVIGETKHMITDPMGWINAKGHNPAVAALGLFFTIAMMGRTAYFAWGYFAHYSSAAQLGLTGVAILAVFFGVHLAFNIVTLILSGIYSVVRPVYDWAVARHAARVAEQQQVSRLRNVLNRLSDPAYLTRVAVGTSAIYASLTVLFHFTPVDHHLAVLNAYRLQASFLIAA